MSIQKNSRGGVRKGAGRKKKETTKVVRVPIRLLDKFKEYLEGCKMRSYKLGQADLWNTHVTPLKKRIEELETELAHTKFKVYVNDPEVQEWLKSVDKSVYEQCKAIQDNIPALRALGTKGVMIVSQILNPSTNGKQG